MIFSSFILMIFSRMLWVLHDLYFWGSKEVKDFVQRVGWHNIKMVFVTAFFFSGYLAGDAAHGWPIWMRLKQLFALALAAWGAFEGFYNALQKDANLFDWFRYLKAGLTQTIFEGMPKDRIGDLLSENPLEFILHHAFRLHWIETVAVVLAGGSILMWGI